MCPGGRRSGPFLSHSLRTWSLHCHLAGTCPIPNSLWEAFGGWGQGLGGTRLGGLVRGGSPSSHTSPATIAFQPGDLDCPGRAPPLPCGKPCHRQHGGSKTALSAAFQHPGHKGPTLSCASSGGTRGAAATPLRWGWAGVGTNLNLRPPGSQRAWGSKPRAPCLVHLSLIHI